MKVEISALKAALRSLLEHAEQINGPVVDIPEDLYWFISREQLNDPAHVPTDLSIGSLEDDWNHITAVARGDKEAFGYMLVWAASVLRAIGDHTP